MSRHTEEISDSRKKKDRGVLARLEPRPPFLFEGELRESESPFFPLRPASRHVISRERSDREIFNPRGEGFLAIARNDKVAA